MIPFPLLLILLPLTPVPLRPISRFYDSLGDSVSSRQPVCTWFVTDSTQKDAAILLQSAKLINDVAFGMCFNDFDVSSFIFSKAVCMHCNCYLALRANL